jgi:hypothetical protein
LRALDCHEGQRLARDPHLDDDFEQKVLRAPQLKSPAGSIYP